MHCVTGWTALDVAVKGVQVKDLAARAKPKKNARHVIFEAAHGYTSNVRIREALADSVMIVHHLAGQPLPRSHGAPARVVVPDLYFWKSAKWITGIRFVAAGRARLLGDARLQQPRRPLEGRAVQLKKLKLRPWLRAMHRDAGYFVIGLTVIYALSGLAVNHIKDWDPNFTQINRTHHVQTPLPEDDDGAAAGRALEAGRRGQAGRRVPRRRHPARHRACPSGPST